MQSKILAKQAVGGQEVDVRATDGGSLHNVPIQRVWTAKGYGWAAMATSAVASLIVRPTTTAIATLFNNTSKNFVIERVFAHNLVSIANGQFGIWLCVHPVGMTAPTNDITVRNSFSGLVAGTEGIFDNGATVVDNGWFPWGESQTSVTATVPGSLAQALVEGRIILPPTAGLSVSVVAQTAVVTTCVGIHWFSVPVTEFALG
ncbi:MAG: hypothetical protein WC455_15700 [Dehalococcoidia bacterium]|jgi:hypothetical protein